MGTGEHRRAAPILTPKERSLRARIGAHALHAAHNPKETTSKGRAAFLARFEKEVDPDGTLPMDERRRRAEHARKKYFATLALKSARSRRARAERRSNYERA